MRPAAVAPIAAAGLALLALACGPKLTPAKLTTEPVADLAAGDSLVRLYIPVACPGDEVGPPTDKPMALAQSPEGTPVLYTERDDESLERHDNGWVEDEQTQFYEASAKVESEIIILTALGPETGTQRVYRQRPSWTEAEDGSLRPPAITGPMWLEQCFAVEGSAAAEAARATAEAEAAAQAEAEAEAGRMGAAPD